MIEVENYIVDYERVNELTVHTNDDHRGGIGGLYVMGARAGVKKYLKTWEDLMFIKASTGVVEFTPEQKHIFNTLLYNGIIVNIKERKRESAIAEILNYGK